MQLLLSVKMYVLLLVISIGHLLSLVAMDSASKKTQDLYILGCSVGGFETEIGLFKFFGNNLELIDKIVKNTKELPTQEEFNSYIAKQMYAFKQTHKANINYAAFAVSGPTQKNQDRILSSHMSYPVDGPSIEKKAQLAKVLVINDFEMSGYGISSLTKNQFEVLHQGLPQEYKPKALIGAGAGLGSCLLVHNGVNAYSTLPMGLNMTAFAPLNEKDFKFFEFLKNKQSAQEPHVGWGTVLGSKGGLAALFQCFYNENSSLTAQDIFVKARKDNEDDERYKDYVDSVDLYMKLYARAIRTFMLLTLPYNGVYITNRIAQDNPALIKSESFIKEILTSGNAVLDEMIQAMPIYLVTDHNLVIRGAAVKMLQYLKNNIQ